MQSDDLFGHSTAAPADPKAQWEGLEKRINRLLETVVQLRNANASIMKENLALKNQMKDLVAPPEASPRTGPVPDPALAEENQKLRKQYETALGDLKQVKENLQRIEGLASELKLEG
ncbi:MAG TPA: hypothetical protein VHE12_13655 [bacterium]|nr:hypothetical protein [bacterium]